MTQVIINDILPRTQAIAIGGQTVYSTTWTAEVAEDVDVYSRPAGTDPVDLTQQLLPSQFNVAFIGSGRIVEVTLITPSTLGDVITITRSTPVDRTNLYTNTNFTPTMLNQDFGLITMEIQENDLSEQQLTPRYPISALINTWDVILPQLGPNESWIMNAAGNQIEAQVISGGGGGNVSLNKFIVQTPDASIPNAQALSALSTGILKSTTVTGVVSISVPLTSIDNLITIADEMIYTTAPNVYAVTAITPVARLLLAQTTFAGIATVLGALPLTGGTMSGIIDMGNNRITNLTDPLLNQDAATRKFVTDNLALFLPLAGGTMALNTGVINMNSSKIVGLEDPTNSQDAATKAYVDLVAIGLNIQQACFAATTANLNAIYNNGALGIGATLTNNGALAAFSVDGVLPAANARILVKDQTTTFQNGIYTLTTVGSGATAWILTRATDYDQPSEINAGDLVIITNGTVNGGTSWIETVTVTAIGVDPILFTQFTFSVNQVLLKTANLSDVASTTSSFNNISPTTTKGDLIVDDGVNDVRLAVGSINGQILQVNAATATGLSYSTATYPPTTVANQLLYSISTNTVTGLATAASATLVTNQLGVPSWIGPMTNGQLVIGSTGAIPVIGSLAAGAGISIVNGPGTITISALGGGGSVNAGLINELAFYAATGSTVSGLTTANNGVLVTNASGVPSISSTLPANLLITTPLIITGLKDSGGNTMFGFTATGSAVNNFQFANAATIGSPTLSAVGLDTNITLTLQGKGTSGVDIKGVSTNSSAGAGIVGEFVSSVVQGSPVNLVSGVATNITSISLTAGDWDVWGNVFATPTGGTIGTFNVWSSTTSATLPATSLRNLNGVAGQVGAGLNMPYARYNVSSTTTVFLSCQAALSAGTCVGTGGIYARRAR